jgi:ElaB/YqjD/DUF883 family membrane-anchored ribosome-binding protein
MADTATTFGVKSESKLSAVTSRAQDTAEDMYGRAREMAHDATDKATVVARQADDYISNLVEERPYTVAFGALALGFILGRMCRDAH